MGIGTLAAAQAELDRWLKASQTIGDGAQSYSIGDRTLTRADLAQVQRQITYWQREVRRFKAAATGARGPGHKVAVWNG